MRIYSQSVRVFQLNVVKGHEICFRFSLVFNMRLGRLHTDTTDQYWGLIDLNSSQELLSYGRYIIPIFTPCSYQSYKP